MSKQERRRRNCCSYCGRPMNRNDYVHTGEHTKRLSPGNIHVRCMFQQTLDRRGKGEQLEDVMREYPHIAAAVDRVERAGEARLRGDEAMVRAILGEWDE